MKKATLAALGCSATTALALVAAMAQADSVSQKDISALEFDMASAAMAASAVITGTVIEAELELEDDGVVWEIEIVNAADQVVTVEVDGETGQILSTDTDDDTDLSHVDALSLARAIEVVKAVETGALIEAELEHEDGTLIWEIESLDQSDRESKFRVHAETGEILI